MKTILKSPLQSHPYFFQSERQARAEKPLKPTLATAAQNTQSDFCPAAADYVEEKYEEPRKIILDLKNPTPETLDAFFPSEQKLRRVDDI